MWKWQNQVRTKERSIEVSQHHHQDCEYCSGYHHLAAASERARCERCRCFSAAGAGVDFLFCGAQGRETRMEGDGSSWKKKEGIVGGGIPGEERLLGDRRSWLMITRSYSIDLYLSYRQ